VFDIASLLVEGDTSIRDALRRLDLTGEGVLLLVAADGSLERAVTDGDLRRLLLAGATMEDGLATLPARRPITAQEGITPAAALSLMNEHGISHLPLLDAVGRPLEVLLRRELSSQILLSTPHLSEHEQQFVAEAFRSNWIAPLGPHVDAFEREVAEVIGVRAAAALSSGTAGLHLALRLLDVGPGDSVICSTLTFVASANPIVYQGATPVFVDSEPETWNMSPAALARALEDARRSGRLPKAVIVVNLYGQSAEMDPLLELCSAYGVPVVEDAAESLGATYKGRASGSFGRIGVLSFNGNKIITTSGGGMLLSDDPLLVERARFLSTQARDPAPWYQHSEVGYNYRMSNVLAGIGRGQLRVLSSRVEARRTVFRRYQEGLSHLAGLDWMPEASFGTSTRWLSVCTVDPGKLGVGPVEVIEALARSGIEARRVWKPMHAQPLFSRCTYYPHHADWSFSDGAFARGMCLPSGSNLGAADQERIIRTLDRVCARGRASTVSVP
jgi:dTDP-4-amino-4,6-dideoxygalactose transaminase